MVRRLPASKCGYTVGFPLFLLLGFGCFPIDPRQRCQLGQDGRQRGGGTDTDRYGNTILDLFGHYASLLLRVATDEGSPGPLQLSAMALEIASLCFMFYVLLTESDASFEERVDEDSCPIDAYDVLNDAEAAFWLSARELEKLNTCIDLEKVERRKEDVPAMINGWIIEEKEGTGEKLDDLGGLLFC